MNPAEVYILKQPEPYRSIVLHLKAVIELTIKEADLVFKWALPCFYLGKTPYCYINVSVKRKYVDLGFWHSAHLTKHLDKMVGENRKVIKSLRYSSLEGIDDEILIAVLKDALSVSTKGFVK